jgi:mono/diheme cytochrome c family protein
MNRCPALVGLAALATLASWPMTALAQSADAPGQQKLGMRLFNQSCRVCHSKPQLSSPQYAPVLSMNTLGGNADVMREVIGAGTPRMPGFKYDFKAAQIDAIIAYIKTIPAPSAPAAPGKTGAPSDAD